MGNEVLVIFLIMLFRSLLLASDFKKPGHIKF